MSASLPCQPETATLAGEGDNKLYEIMHTKGTLQAAEGPVSKSAVEPPGRVLWPALPAPARAIQ